MDFIVYKHALVEGNAGYLSTKHSSAGMNVSEATNLDFSLGVLDQHHRSARTSPPLTPQYL